jgi:hypothetical protein
MAVARHPLEDAMRLEQGRRHQRRGLVAGKAEHDALVAGAFILVAGLVDALGDVGRLAVEMAGEIGILPVEAMLLIADALDRGADGRLDLVDRRRDPVAAADLAGETMRLVVTIVSQATRATGSRDRNRSTTASEIWSATLSGWPSDTDSEVNR